MKLEEFGNKYGDFYVPSFVAKVGNQDMVRELFLTVTRVEVGMKQNAAADFSLTIASAFDWEKRDFVAMRDQERVDLIELFEFGAPVEIMMGYGDAASLNPMLNGIVTRVGTGFSESGTPELTIGGFDKLHPLTIGKETHHWENKRDSDVVRDIATRNNLDPDVTTTEPSKDRIDQNEQSDFEFLRKLAERNDDVIFYVRGNKLHFGPRRRKETAQIQLDWGGGLSSFSPTANIARQVTAVEVCGTSAETGRAFVGRAERGDESDNENTRESGSGRIAKALGRSPVMRVRAAVRNEAEAKARARAILQERGQDLVTGDGECVGLPDIVPDINVNIGQVGRAFSKAYYVTEATHTIDSSGYRTRFQVREMLV
jgi:phage protein D